MKILLFGKNGQVGWELNRSLQPLGEVIALVREDIDFTDVQSLRDIVAKTNPDVIVNAVAYTAVDKAEEEVELATAINGLAPRVLAEEALKVNALLVHYSTDYVFDGSKDKPYEETDVPDPVNVYGSTKLSGEQNIQSSGCRYLIFRTSWVYASRGHNFLLTILKLAKEREELSIVSDQIGSPTPARLIAETTILCLNKSLDKLQDNSFISDIYNLTTANRTSWHGFAEEIVAVVSKRQDHPLKIKNINAIPTSEYPTPADRPKNSQLVLNKLETTFNIVMPDWKKALGLCIEEIK